MPNKQKPKRKNPNIARAAALVERNATIRNRVLIERHRVKDVAVDFNLTDERIYQLIGNRNKPPREA